MIEEKFYTTEQVATTLQVHPFTILKFIRQGKLKGVKIGRVYRIQESEVNRFLEERLTTTRTPKAREERPIPPTPVTQELKTSPEEVIKSQPEDDQHYYII